MESSKESRISYKLNIKSFFLFPILIFISTNILAQDYSADDELFIDSLLKSGIDQVFTISDFRVNTFTSNSLVGRIKDPVLNCSFDVNYMIVWEGNQSDSIYFKFANKCFQSINHINIKRSFYDSLDFIFVNKRLLLEDSLFFRDTINSKLTNNENFLRFEKFSNMTNHSFYYKTIAVQDDKFDEINRGGDVMISRILRVFNREKHFFLNNNQIKQHNWSKS